MQSDSNRLAYLYVLGGASLWGIIGLFVDQLYGAGFTALQIVTLRVVSAAGMLVLWLAFRSPALLRIDKKDLPGFIGTGIFSIVLFNWSYFTAIEEVSLSVAVILLYTGPIFVTLLSRVFLKEPLTTRKIAALLLTVLGCALVIKVLPISDRRISLYGFVIGLTSGFGYALYSIFGKNLLRKYEPLTVITYTFILASVVMIPLSGFSISVHQLGSLQIWLVILGLGFFPTALAYLLYTNGLSMIESSRASIAATVEPVVATVIGVSVFNEVLTGYQLAGMVLVLAAVMLIQLKKRSKEIR